AGSRGRPLPPPEGRRRGRDRRPAPVHRRGGESVRRAEARRDGDRRGHPRLLAQVSRALQVSRRDRVRSRPPTPADRQGAQARASRRRRGNRGPGGGPFVIVVFPAVATLVSAVFAIQLLTSYAHRKRLPQLAWGIAMAMYAVASLAVAAGVSGGWD